MTIYYDRVQETTTTTGSGTLTLGGAVTGYQSFAVVGDGNFCTYCLTDGTDWEVGLGMYTLSGTTLSRGVIFGSSHSGLIITWGAGLKTVYVTEPAALIGQPYQNYLINSDFQITQRIGSTTGTSGTTWNGRIMSSDRWAMESSSASYLAGEAIAPNAGQSYLLAGAPTNKILVYQIIEAINFSGKVVTFQINLKSITNNGNVRVGLLGSTNIVDTVVAPIVSTWGATGADPTWGNYISELKVETVPINTSTATAVTITTVPTTTNNLICAVWSDAAVTAGDGIIHDSAALTAEYVPMAWVKPNPQVELARCQRFYEKSFDPNVPAAFQTGSFSGPLICRSPTAAAGGCWCPYKVTKRAGSSVSTPTLYNPSASVNASSWRTYNDTANAAGSVLNSGGSSPGYNGFFANNTTATAGIYCIHWSVDCEL